MSTQLHSPAAGIERLQRHIERHTPFLTPAERELFAPSPAELHLLERSQEIARRMSPPRTWSQRSSLERTACAAILLKALQGLHQVCLYMGLPDEAKRPTEAQYQRAMENAKRAIATVTGSCA